LEGGVSNLIVEGRHTLCAPHVGRLLNRNHEFDHPPPHHHLRRPNTDMDSQNPFSKGFKKLRHKLAGGSRERDGKHGSKNDRGGSEVDAEGSEASQRNSLHSEVEEVVDGPSRGENDVDGKEVCQVDPPISTPLIPHSGEPNSM
jgi:hypothetical protein